MANDLNKLFLIGRLTKDLGSDPQGRDFGYLQNGTCKGVISIAVNRSKKQADGTYADEVSYFDINIWGKMAENLKPYLLRGTQVMVEAIIKQERWKDKQTGENRSKIAIHADNIQLLGIKRDNSEQHSQYAQQYQQQQYGTSQFIPANNGFQIQQPVQQQQFNGIQPHNNGFPEDLNFNNEEIPF